MIYEFIYNRISSRLDPDCLLPEALLNKHPKALKTLIEQRGFLATASEFGLQATQAAASTPSAFSNFRVPQSPAIRFPLLVYSHRGGSLEKDEKSGFHFVENSLPAFRNSARLGVDLLELDVQLTRDKKVVVFHDTDLSRIYGPSYIGKCVADLDYHQLPLEPDRGYVYHPRSMYDVPHDNASHQHHHWSQHHHWIQHPPGHHGCKWNRSREGEEAGQKSGWGGWGWWGWRRGETRSDDSSTAPCSPPPSSSPPSSSASLVGSEIQDKTEVSGREIPNPVATDPDRFRIPLFEEVLREFPEIPIQVDLKSPRKNTSISGPSTCPAPRLTSQTPSPSPSPSPSPYPPPSTSSLPSSNESSLVESRIVEKLEMVNEVHDLLRTHGRDASNTLWGSFDHETQSLCYLVNPDLPLFMSMLRGVKVLSAFKAGKLDEIPIYESAIIMPRQFRNPHDSRHGGGRNGWGWGWGWRGGMKEEDKEEAVKVGQEGELIKKEKKANEREKQEKKAECGWWKDKTKEKQRWRSGEWLLLDPEFQKAMKDKGVAVILYGDLNGEEVYEKLKEGVKEGRVRGLCTDEPAKLKEFLERQGIQDCNAKE